MLKINKSDQILTGYSMINNTPVCYFCANYGWNENSYMLQKHFTNIAMFKANYEQILMDEQEFIDKAFDFYCGEDFDPDIFAPSEKQKELQEEYLQDVLDVLTQEDEK